MKLNKLFLGALIMFISINFVFAATSSWCTDKDSIEAAGSVPLGVNYYQNSYNSGKNMDTSWSYVQDSCNGNILTEVYCDKDETGMWVKRTKTFNCGVNGCDPSKKICRVSAGQMTGKVTLDSTTGTYIGILIVIVLLVIVLWFFFKKKKKKK